MTQPFLRDALGQLEVLLRRKGELDTGKALPVSAANAPRLPKVNKLNEADVGKSLQLLQTWLAFFAKDHLHEICEKLMAYSSTFDSGDKNDKKKSKKERPGTKDTMETVDDLHDDSVDYFLLQTMVICLKKNVENDTSHSQIRTISHKVLQFCFDRIDYALAPGVRHQATQCVAVLSQFHLEKICEQFMRKLTGMKKKDEHREYVPYQKAVADFSFGFHPRERAVVTVKYFSELAAAMQKIERGVLRFEICQAVSAVLQSLLKSDDHEKAKEWEDFVNQGGGELTRFWSAYSSIYDTVNKWSAKAKHTVFCYHLMTVMAAIGSFEFYSARRDDILKKLIEGLKRDKDLRAPCLPYIRDFVHMLSESYVQRDQEHFTSQLKNITGVMFPLKKVSSEEEQDVLHEIMCEMALKHVHYIINVVQEVLKSDRYSSEQKSVALRALSFIARKYPEEIDTYSFTLGPLMTPFIEETNEEVLLRAALPCFPSIHHPNPAKFKQMVLRIGELTQSADHEVSNKAARCLQEYLQSKPDENVVHVLATMVRVLSNTNPSHTDHLLKTFNNIAFMVDNYIERGVESIDTKVTDNAHFVALRTRAEGTCLLWLTSPDHMIRNEAAKLAKLLSHEVFMKLEKASELPTCGYLTDAINLDGTEEEVWPDYLTTIVTTKYGDFKEAISWAWMQMSSVYNIFKKSHALPESEGMMVWSNHLKFLCMSVRIDPEVSRKFTLDDESPAVAAKINELHNLDMQICQDGYTDVQTVGCCFQDMIQLLCSADQDSIRDMIFTGIDLLHPSAHEELIRQIKIHSENQKGGRNKNALSQYYHHEQTLHLLARLYATMTPEGYMSSAEDIQVLLTDFVSTWINESSHKTLMGLTKSRQRAHAVVLMGLYFSLAGSEKDTDYMQNTYKELLNMMPPGESTVSHGRGGGQQESAGDRHRLEVAILQALSDLLSIETLNFKYTEDAVWNFIIQSLDRGDYLHPKAQKALQQLLYKNPHRLDDFIKCCHPEHHKVDDEKEPTTSAATLAKLHVHSVAGSVVMDPAYWLQKVGVDPAKLMLVAIYHQASADADVRQLAIDLSNALARGCEGFKYDPGYDLPVFTHDSHHIYVTSSVRYSRALAKNFLPQTLHLMQSAVGYAAFLDEENKELLLRVLQPWMESMGTYATHYYQSHPEDCRGVLSALFDITRHCEKSSFVMSTVGPLWQSLLDDAKHGMNAVPCVVQFLIRHYLTALEVGYAFPGDANLIKLIFVYISRSELGEQVLIEICTYLRSYNTDAPNDPQEFMEWQRKRGAESEDITDTELAAFDVLVDLAFDYKKEVVTRLPLILHCASVLRSLPSASGPFQGDQMLCNLVHSLGHRNASNTEDRKDVVGFFRGLARPVDRRSVKFSTKQTRDVVARLKNLSIASMMEGSDGTQGPISTDTIDSMMKIFVPHCPHLEKEWSDLALSWAVMSRDPRISLESFRVFGAFNVEVTKELLHRLIMCLFTAIRDGEDEKVTIIAGIIARYPKMKEHGGLTAENRNIIASIGLILLNSSAVAQYAHGVRIIQSVIDCTPESEKQALFGHLESVIPTGDTGASLDAAISRLLFRGTTANVTLMSTISVIEQLANVYSHKLAPDNCLAALLMILYSALVVSGDEDAANMGIAFCRNSPHNLNDFAELMASQRPAVFAPKAKSVDALRRASVFAPPGSPMTTQQKTFMDRFAEIYNNRFASTDSFAYSQRAIVALLRRGVMSWRLPLLQLLLRIIAHNKDDWAGDQYAEVANLVVEYSFDYNSSIIAATTDLMDYMLVHAPEVVSPEVFDYLREKPRQVSTILRRMSNIMTMVPDTHLFPFSSKEDLENDRTTLLSKIRMDIFGLGDMDIYETSDNASEAFIQNRDAEAPATAAAVAAVARASFASSVAQETPAGGSVSEAAPPKIGAIATARKSVDFSAPPPALSEAPTTIEAPAAPSGVLKASTLAALAEPQPTLGGLLGGSFGSGLLSSGADLPSLAIPKPLSNEGPRKSYTATPSQQYDSESD